MLPASVNGEGARSASGEGTVGRAGHSVTIACERSWSMIGTIQSLSRSAIAMRLARQRVHHGCKRRPTCKRQTMEPQRTRAAEAVMTERCHITRLSSGPLHSRQQTSKSLRASCEGRPPDAISLCLQNGPERLFTPSSQHSSFRLTPIAAEIMMSPMHLISPRFNRNQNVRQAQRSREVHHRLGESSGQRRDNDRQYSPRFGAERRH